MEEIVLASVKDITAFVLSYNLAINLLALESHIVTGLFALGGIVLGRVLDWSWELYKKRRAKRKSRKKLTP